VVVEKKKKKNPMKGHETEEVHSCGKRDGNTKRGNPFWKNEGPAFPPRRKAYHIARGGKRIHFRQSTSPRFRKEDSKLKKAC